MLNHLLNPDDEHDPYGGNPDIDEDEEICDEGPDGEDYEYEQDLRDARFWGESYESWMSR